MGGLYIPIIFQYWAVLVLWKSGVIPNCSRVRVNWTWPITHSITGSKTLINRSWVWTQNPPIIRVFFLFFFFSFLAWNQHWFGERNMNLNLRFWYTLKKIQNVTRMFLKELLLKGNQLWTFFQQKGTTQTLVIGLV